MSPPPNLHDEVSVIRKGRLTRYNDDNTANVKLSTGRGRPNKIHFSDFVNAPVIPQPDPKSLPSRKGWWAAAGTGLAGIIGGLWTGVLQAAGGQAWVMLLKLLG